MKKLILILTVFMCLALVSALAEGYQITTSKRVDMAVTMEISELYQPIIPAELPITYGVQSVPLTVEIAELRLPSGSVLRVTADTEGRLEDKSDTSSYIAFTIQGEGEPPEIPACLTFDSTGQKDMIISVERDEWRKAVSGRTYSGIITFSFDIAEMTANAEGDDTQPNEQDN